MYEHILGRPASEAEIKFLSVGPDPELHFGELVTIPHRGVEGKINGIVLFALPPTPQTMQAHLAWGFRVEGVDEFFPSAALKVVA